MSRKQNETLNTKIKAVTLAQLHPNWSVKSLRSKTTTALLNKKYIKRWESEVLAGGTKYDKFIIINNWTLDRFTKARSELQQVTTIDLQQWALAAASQFQDTGFQFAATKAWVHNMKHNNEIRQRKITKFVSKHEWVTMGETLEAATKFKTMIAFIIPKFSPSYVINTDRTGCQYQSTFHRTLTNVGGKTVLVQKHNLAKTTHSYTAQYSLTLEEKVIPKVFLCFQEPGNSFGPLVQKKKWMNCQCHMAMLLLRAQNPEN